MYLQHLVELSHQAQTQLHRYAIELIGESDWTTGLLTQFIALRPNGRYCKLGGDALANHHSLGYKAGAQLLGQDIDGLIYDAADGFDANSLAAAAGTIVGGGLLFIINRRCDQADCGQVWLEQCCAQLITLRQDSPLPARHLLATPPANIDDSEQKDAIDAINKVLHGHRKRPLVITADRGRGKSAALGMAAGALMKTRKLKILLTAPTPKAVSSVFKHAQLELGSDAHTTSALALSYHDSSLAFIAPDELLKTQPKCDLLLVDEAAAIPVPMLKAVVESYHRLVFSSTIHGYEGCGRGFTLKFLPWLQSVRPGGEHHHLKQPMRWAKDDPLESWLFESFLLNAELDNAQVDLDHVEFRALSRAELVADIGLLRRCFALLVNAHYQTSPNDLLQILSDDSVSLYAGFCGDVCVACVSVVKEGELAAEVIEQIRLGKRRPKGHLIPAALVNHLGVVSAAEQRCYRVMRIAVHPVWQGEGVGSKMLAWLAGQLSRENGYLATSFGATAELVQFWQRCGFQPVWLGSSRDHSSGCHSVVMLRCLCEQSEAWILNARRYWYDNFSVLLASTFVELEPSIVVTLLKQNIAAPPQPSAHAIQQLYFYAQGGGSIDAITAAAQKMVLHCLSQSNPSSISYQLLVAKLLQHHDWQQLCVSSQLSGRKAAEQKIRDEIAQLVKQFTV